MRRLVCGSLGALVAMFLAVDRTAILAVLLWLLRRQHPEMFGEEAVRGVYASIAEATA